jgi:hypothetical protein
VVDDLAQIDCEDCGHPMLMHHPALTRGDGCIGKPFTARDMATLSEIRAGRSCGCPIEPEKRP